MLNITKRTGFNDQGGFTMVEVVVASAIMMVVFVALLGSVTFARRVQSLTENKLACLHIAREYMEPFSNMAYGSSEFETGSWTLPGNRGTCYISEVSGTKNKDVVITINWVEPTGRHQSVSLTSSYSRSLHR